MKLKMELPDGRIIEQDKPENAMDALAMIFELGYNYQRDLFCLKKCYPAEAEYKVSHQQFKKNCQRMMKELPDGMRKSGGIVRDAVDLAWQRISAAKG